MDKELLRIVIIATGLMIIMGMLTWSYLRNKKSQEDLDFDDGEELNTPPDKSLDIQNDDLFDMGNDGFFAMDDDPSAGADHHFFDQDDAVYEPEEDEFEPTPRAAVPDVIQFSLAAKTDEGFNGIDVVNAFKIAGLEYGNLKIYERLDANRLVDFGVACMVEPGTFPDSNLDSFYCPGLVFFMQPGAVDDAQAVFDDYIDTIQLIAMGLDGDILDHRRHPLTDATIQSIRQAL